MNYYYHDTPTKKKRNKKSPINTKVIIAIFTILVFVLSIKACSNSQSEEVTFLISNGESIQSITDRLIEEDIISSSFLFKNYLSSNNLDTQIQAGSFTLQTNSNPSQVASILTDSSQANQMRVTIPEGYKISQIDETLTQLGLIEEGQFTNFTRNYQQDHPIQDLLPNGKNSLEGFLYPDTYFVDPATFQISTFTENMLNNFLSKLPADYETQINKTPANNLYELITMASIVEREVLSPTDKATVAGLLWKRLESGWRIDADAALLYDQDDNIITQTDLQSDSPYNLRKFQGLTPTPISNPSLETIQATLNPIDSDYWFYLTTIDTGEVIYSRTLEEHNANVQRYLR